MSNLPGNPFAELIEPLSGQHAEVAVGLALAYEQRTANLMKLWEIGQNDFPGEMMTDVENQMLQRLGLGDTK